MLYVVDKIVDPTKLKYKESDHRSCSLRTRNMVNENVRPDMLQEIAGLLQKLAKEAPDIYYFA